MKGYDEILSAMREKYTQRTGTSPDEATDIGVRLSVLAGEVFSLYAQLNWLEHQMFPNTAEGEWLELHAAQRGLERRGGRKAVGEVHFYLPYAMTFDVTVPEGTVCATAGSEPVRFRTTEQVTIPSGRMNARAAVEALEEGAAGNVAEQVISVLVTPVTGVSSVSNDERTVLGADEESDEMLRKRVLDSFFNIPNGTNKAYYINSAMSVEGVTAAGVIPQRRGPGTVDVYIASSEGTPSLSLLREVREKLQREREINVDVAVQALSIVTYNVYMYLSVKPGYDFDEVSGRVRESIRAYLNSLGGGENVYVSKISEAVAHVEGVKDHSFVDRLTYDVNIDANCAARCGAVSITERE